MIGGIFLEPRGEERADGTARLDVALDFGDAGMQMRDHAHAWQENQRHAAVEQNLRRTDILPQIELSRIRPVQRMAAKPDDYDPVDDLRRAQQRRGYVADRRDRHTHKADPRVCSPAPVR